MGSEEDIARTLSKINAHLDTPLTQEQERVVQKMLRRQPMLLGPRLTRIQRIAMYGTTATWIILGLLVLILCWSGQLPSYAIGFAVPLIWVVERVASAYFPVPTATPNRSTLRHIRALLEPHHGFVCLRCHYPLTSLPDDGQCPECGTLYTREQTVRAWKDAYKLKDDWTE